MKYLYFCRHGESFVNIDDIFATRLGTEHDKGLTPRGCEQANICGDDILSKGLKFDLMLSSPLSRARETAEIIAGRISYPKEQIDIWHDLQEVQYGSLEGTTWHDFWNSGHTYADLVDYAGAETIEALQLRAASAFRQIEQRPEQTILVVSHSAFGRALRRVVENRPYTDEFNGEASLPHAKILEFI